MKKNKGKLIVQEFDKITTNINYQNVNGYKYLAENYFNELENFICYFSDETKEENDISKFVNISFKKGCGRVIVIKNYIGLIELKSGFQIEILPKINFGDKNNNYELTKIKVIEMLKSLSNYQNQLFNMASVAIANMDIYEVFINMYLKAVQKLVKEGLKSDYVEVTQNLKTLKGKITISKQISKNLCHRERMYCNYYEYNINRVDFRDTENEYDIIIDPKNEFIESPSRSLLNRISVQSENKKLIMILWPYFDLVEESTNYEVDFANIVIDRINKSYAQILDWSKIILRKQSFSTFSGNIETKTLLFPMEKLFESYVAKYVKKVFKTVNWQVILQDKRYYLFDYPRAKFQLKPDIVLKKNDQIIIMDTKWKKLKLNESNYGISQADMYPKKYQTKDVWLLYPLREELTNGDIKNFVSNDEITVHIYFIDLADTEGSINRLLQEI